MAELLLELVMDDLCLFIDDDLAGRDRTGYDHIIQNLELVGVLDGEEEAGQLRLIREHDVGRSWGHIDDHLAGGDSTGEQDSTLVFEEALVADVDDEVVAVITVECKRRGSRHVEVRDADYIDAVGCATVNGG